MKVNHGLWIIGLFLLMLLVRFTPHMGNFSPFLALCLFSGSVSRGGLKGGMIIFSAVILTDYSLGFYSGWQFTYLGFAFLALSGANLGLVWSSVLSRALFGVFGFYVFSNLGVWYSSGLYVLTLEGLMDCYFMGVPFLIRSLTSTLIYSSVFFFIYSLWKKSEQRASRGSIVHG